jgi:hypothetical protein
MVRRRRTKRRNGAAARWWIGGYPCGTVPRQVVIVIVAVTIKTEMAARLGQHRLCVRLLWLSVLLVLLVHGG